MGNRAIITNKDKKICIYLHWNGGRDSVEAFLTFCRMKGFRSFEADDDYAFAQLLRVATNFISSDGLSVGLGLYDNNNNNEYIDNGVYVIGKDWKIIDRLFFKDVERQEYNLKDMVIAINDSQPENIRLSSDEIENYFINNPLKELI